jgi:hypothetical protein
MNGQCLGSSGELPRPPINIFDARFTYGELHTGHENVVQEKNKTAMVHDAANSLLSSAARRIISAIHTLGRRGMKSNWCFMLAPLAVLLVPIPAPGQQQTPSPVGWQLTQKPDPGHENSPAQFALLGKFLTRPPKDSGTPPALVVNCKRHRSGKRFSSAYVDVGTLLKIDFVEPDEIKAGTSYYPKVFVQYRLNDGKEEKDQWTPGTEKTSASIPKKSLEKMLQARTVQIKLEDRGGGEISMQFDISDSAQLGATCDLPVRKK